MISSNYFTDDEDLQIIFSELVDWKTIVEECEGKDFIEHKKYLETNNSIYEMAPSNWKEAYELYESSLKSLGEFFGKEVSQNSQAMDRKELVFKDGKVIFPQETIEIYEKFKDTGLISYSISREAGGLGFPATMGAFFVLVMARADVSFCMTITLLNLAQIVSRYGNKEQIDKYANAAATGKSLFAMALTEPDFGSDLNSVRTVAEKQEDGTYRITGTKRFISQGCGLGEHPSLLLTLARTGKQGGGARGLSVFIVKSSDVEVAGIEKKMGIHASPTCEIVYENTFAELLGEEGLGLTRYTAGMTNFMRLGSAAGGPGGAAGVYFESIKYANERMQFGKPIAQIPAVDEMLRKIKREMNAMRLLVIETGRVVDLYQHHQIRMEKEGKEDREIRRDDKVKYWSTIASILTPIAKYYGSEEGHKIASIGVQIHGGAGYTEDYDVSRMFRDSRINTIYEGTSQIHVRIATGAILAGMNGDGNFRKYLTDLRSDISNPSKYLLEQNDILEDSIIKLRKITIDDTKERLAENLMIQASRFLCTILYERAIMKLSKEVIKSRWMQECKSYSIESTAIAKYCNYRISHF